ncbi:RNA-processing protein [Candidatus Pacearchaeota archaeon]|nr:RNA-processing protein [Candidatus Pacearchaeota archaeon]
MKKLISEKLPRILKNKRTLEKELNVKITNSGKEISISGESVDEYVAEKVIDAINLGFPLSVALEIKSEDFTFEVINIKDYTKRKDMGAIKARIIGKEGKTLRTLNNLTDCNFEILGHEVGIIGDSENIEAARQAIISLIQGAKQANVYAYLEKHHPLPVFDLGLKEEKKKRKNKL